MGGESIMKSNSTNKSLPTDKYPKNGRALPRIKNADSSPVRGYKRNGAEPKQSKDTMFFGQ